MKPSSKWLVLIGLLLLGLALIPLGKQGTSPQGTERINPLGALPVNQDSQSSALIRSDERASVAIDGLIESSAEDGTKVLGWITLRSAYAAPLGPGLIRLSTEAGWNHIDAEGEIELRMPALEIERVARFPGYQEVLISAGPGVYELTAESSLTFRGPPGGSAAVIWESSLNEWALPETLVATQLLNTGSEIMLISNLASDRRNRSNKPWVSFQIQLTSGWLVKGIWQLHQGEHHEVTLAMEQTRNLDTHDLVITAWSPDPSQVTDRTWQWQLQTGTAPTSDLLPIEPEVPWGTLLIEPALGWSDFPRFWSTGNPATFEELFIGGTYLAAMHSSDWSEIGQARFIFDGSPITIETEPGWLVEAHLVDSRTRAPIDRTQVRLDMDFSSGDPSDGSFTWGGKVILASDPEGALFTPLFTMVPVSVYYPWSPPTRVQLHIKVRGYEELTLTATRTPHFGTIDDLGRIDLVPLEPSFRFRLLSASQDTPNFVYLGTGPDSIESMLETWLMREEDQLFGARTSNNEVNEDQLFLDRVQLAAARSEGLILSGDHGHRHAVSASNGIWQEVPSKDWSLPVHASETTRSAGDLRVGYTWQGVDVSLGIFRNTEPNWVFHAPLEGVKIWVEDQTVAGQPFRRPLLELEDGVVLNL